MIYYLYANNRNIGDYLSSRGIQNLLDIPGELVPFEKNQALVESLFRNAKKTDLFVIGGGGLFMDHFEPFWELLNDCYRQNEFSYVIWGVGYCSLKGRGTLADSQVLDLVIKNSVYATVRDQFTLDQIKSYEQVELVPCPAINEIQVIKKSESHFVSENVCLQVDHPALLRNHAKYKNDENISLMIDAICKSLAENCGLQLVKTENVLQKKSRLQKLMSVFKRDGGSIEEQVEKDISGLIADNYLPSKYIITSRLHGAIIGLSLGKKVVGFSSDAKIDAFFSILGLDSWVCEDVEALKELVARIDSQPDVSNAVNDICLKNKKFAEKVRGFYFSLQ